MPSSSPSSKNKLAITRANAIGRLLLLARKGFLRRVSQDMRARGQQELPASFLLLSPFIDAAGTRNSELAERAGVSKQAIGKIVKEYEQIGLLVRDPDERDGRAWRVRITDEGLRQLAQTHRVVARIEQHYESLIGAARLADMRQALRMIADDAPLSAAVPARTRKAGR
jgi:DNA-binding MarR family transcriptional regulator